MDAERGEGHRHKIRDGMYPEIGKRGGNEYECGFWTALICR
jgi:hypothetical protein